MFVRTSVDNCINLLNTDNISKIVGMQSSVQNDTSKGQAIVAVENNVFITWEDSVIEIGDPMGNDKTAFNKVLMEA